ncbi:MAG: carbon-nitrogen hydrolase family protein [Dehalococcoidales bacterium]|nr:carbon-nitrogen hydrolase family protein [Dehalococcoidales bacterium]
MVACGDDVDANLVKGGKYCRRAKEMGADIALFPEMWNIGYPFQDPVESDFRREFPLKAVGQEDKFVRHFRSLAKELDMAIAITYLEKSSGLPGDSVSIIDRHGEVLMTYAKVHTCDFSFDALCAPGEDFYVCDLDTAAGEVKIGAMICYDREFPESARILMLKGAEIILTPNACELEQNRLGQFRARAYENMAGVATANYAAPQANGHSAAFSGIAYAPDETSLDMTIVEAGEEEGVYIAEFDMEALRDYREREAWGNAYRKPGRYGLLTSEEVNYPFIRKDARR